MSKIENLTQDEVRLLDEFASVAGNHLYGRDDCSNPDVAKFSYNFATAMIAERRKYMSNANTFTPSSPPTGPNTFTPCCPRGMVFGPGPQPWVSEEPDEYKPSVDAPSVPARPYAEVRKELGLPDAPKLVGNELMNALKERDIARSVAQNIADISETNSKNFVRERDNLRFEIEKLRAELAEVQPVLNAVVRWFDPHSVSWQNQDSMTLQAYAERLRDTLKKSEGAK